MAGWQSHFVVMCNDPLSLVSAHYSVGKAGHIIQHVPDDMAAWHAGVVYQATWPLRVPGVSVNWTTIGIEVEAMAGETWTEAEVDAVIYLLRKAWRDHAIRPGIETAVRHSAIYALHACPGDQVPVELIAARAHQLGPLGVGE